MAIARSLITVAVAASVAVLAPLSPASAAPADRLDPELVGTEGTAFALQVELDGAVYALSSSGVVNRIDGDAPEPFGPLFSSVNGMAAFQGALHLITLAGDNTFNVERLQLDGTTSTTLEDGAATFLGGITRIGGFDDELYAASTVANGEIAFATGDGITWSSSSFLGTVPDSIQAIVTVGDDLYVDGFISGVRGVYRWVAPDWTLVSGISGGVNTINAGVGRLLVGTSEGLYSVSGSTATELDGTVANPRSMAEFDGEVWWVDDDNELRSIDAVGARTTHPLPSGAIATGRLFATADAIYYSVRVDSSDSTYRIELSPAAAPEPELAATGASDVAPLAGGLAVAMALLGAALIAARGRRDAVALSRS